jgi:hypothetical protein
MFANAAECVDKHHDTKFLIPRARLSPFFTKGKKPNRISNKSLAKLLLRIKQFNQWVWSMKNKIVPEKLTDSNNKYTELSRSPLCYPLFFLADTLRKNNRTAFVQLTSPKSHSCHLFRNIEIMPFYSEANPVLWLWFVRSSTYKYIPSSLIARARISPLVSV